MKKEYLIVSLAIVLAALIVVFAPRVIPGPEPEREKLTLVFHPGESSELGVLKERFGTVIDALCEELDMECELVLGTSYAATMEALRNGTSDISRIGASMYVLSRDEINVRPVVWDIIGGEDHYHAVLMGKPGIWEEPFALEQLRGKSVAFVDVSSTSGYIAPMTAMLEEGLTLDDLGSYSFTTSHYVGIEALLNGQVDVACTGNTLVDEVVASGEGVEGKNFVLLWESPPLVMDAWVIGPKVDPGLADRIAEALLNLPPEAFEGSFIDGFSPVDLAAYEFNEKMLRAIGEIE